MPNNNDIEIDIGDLFFLLLHKMWFILLWGILSAAAAIFISKVLITPVYTSSTKLYIINRQNKDTITSSDLQTGSQLTQDYKILVLSRPVTEQVLSKLNLDMTHEELVSNITVKVPENTRILEISVQNPNPETAKQLADSIAEESAERMVSILEMEKVNIVEEGDIPSFPTSPSIIKNAILGSLAGAFISTFIIILIHIIDDTVKDVEQIEKYLGLTVLGTIPLETKYAGKIKNKKKAIKKRKKEENIYPEGISIEKASLEFSVNEAYKTLRTNIQFCGKDIKTICITSSLPDEGKTVVAFRLATALSESGKKVLFIDADLRKSVIVNRLKISNGANGLSQYLSGMSTLEEVIHKTNVENVDIIFTGILPPHPSEMLENEEFKDLVRSQREIYDYIIIDTPPLGVVIDSANVAEICDGTILVIESGKISYRLIQRVLKQLITGKSRVLGAVLNKANIYGKGYKKNYYGKYYGR
ncbi:polysaccharide biosynthesis tyrosine autokinase [Anaerocolumna aminovalerica]|uniref:polysaccharide biosynthesis tyrosine autokinase n=1 Tax=Anaerocolumna aminovalerica TaxID=1527 RepID=UPI001C0EE709|nr:polysaccharide biosynthesis tyrosine autokinase [Anaerocolumna aminovalerica]MBU5333622.1 polysaccharide biosynthesis tyrosine autokinase [Anaerocolumna aminovalerica]